MRVKTIAVILIIAFFLTTVLSACQERSPEIGTWKTELSLTDQMFGGSSDVTYDMLKYILTGGNDVDLYLVMDGENYELSIDNVMLEFKKQ